MNKILWCTSFRSFNKSNKNDCVQNFFINSIESIEDFKVKLIVTQFNELGVNERLEKSKIDYIYIKDNTLLPENTKYSQSIIFINAVKEYINGDYDYLVWSTCDFLFAHKFISNLLNKIKNNEDFLSCIIPQNSINEFGDLRIFSFDYGIDFFIFKIDDKNKRERMLKIVSEYDNYNWGAYEHFLCSMKDILNINSYNGFDRTNIFKFDNDREVFNESRMNQISEWNQNKNRLIKIYKEYNISSLYIKGSMIYLFFKITRIQDLNLKLLLKVLILFKKSLFNLVKKILWF